MMSALFVLFCLLVASKCSDTEEYGCDIFSNYFTVDQGQFKDVCGNITMYGVDSNKNRLTSSYLSDHINQNDNTFTIENHELIGFTPYVVFDGDEWVIIFEGYSTRSTQSGFNIILGPGGESGNCQLRYEYGNAICIYSYYGTGINAPSLGYTSYSQCISLPYDINQLHTLLLYYKTGTLSVYQNNVFVDSVQKDLHIAFSRIGGWYHTYYGDVAIKNIKFSKNVALAEIPSYNHTSSPTSTTSTTTAKPYTTTTTTTAASKMCDCERNEETVGLSCITRSAQGEQWVTGRSDAFLEPNVLSKHFIADIINDNKKIYKYRIQWFSNRHWSEWYFPGVNDNEWTAKSDFDNVWNEAHKDAGRRSWTLFSDHFHEVCYLMNETSTICDCKTNEEAVGIFCKTRSAQGERWVTGRGDTFLEPNVLSKHFIADIVNDNKKIYKYRLQWFSNGHWSKWYLPGVNDNEWTAKGDWDNVWNQAHKDGGRRSWTMFADHFHQVCYLMNETVSIVTPSSTTTSTTSSIEISRVTTTAHTEDVMTTSTTSSIEISRVITTAHTEDVMITSSSDFNCLSVSVFKFFVFLSFFWQCC